MVSVTRENNSTEGSKRDDEVMLPKRRMDHRKVKGWRPIQVMRLARMQLDRLDCTSIRQAELHRIALRLIYRS